LLLSGIARALLAGNATETAKAAASHAVDFDAATRGAGCQFDVAVTRWQNFTGQTATLEETGEAFEAKE
jgi:hypothetical protein